MRSEEKARAREMRRRGCSYSEILEQVAVSNSTLSLWLRDIELTDEQIAALQSRFLGGREKFIRAMRARRDERWAEYRQEAEREWPALRQDPEFMFGLALYIGEGSKTRKDAVCLTNCDPRVIQRGLRFFLRAGIPPEALRVSIHLHPGLSRADAEEYWGRVTGLPADQFHTTVEAVSRASTRRKGNVQVHGTCHLYGFSTKVRQKVETWMDLALDGPLV